MQDGRRYSTASGKDDFYLVVFFYVNFAEFFVSELRGLDEKKPRVENLVTLSL
jgi:hypothetical protein